MAAVREQKSVELDTWNQLKTERILELGVVIMQLDTQKVRMTKMVKAKDKGIDGSINGAKEHGTS